MIKKHRQKTDCVDNRLRTFLFQTALLELFIGFLAALSLHGSITRRLGELHLHLFVMVLESLDTMLGRLCSVWVLEHNKCLASHPDVFMSYDIDNFTELGERRLQILLENGQFDRFIEVADVQRVGRHAANSCLSSSDVSTPRAARSTGENMSDQMGQCPVLHYGLSWR